MLTRRETYIKHMLNTEKGQRHLKNTQISERRVNHRKIIINMHWTCLEIFSLWISVSCSKLILSCLLPLVTIKTSLQRVCSLSHASQHLDCKSSHQRFIWLSSGHLWSFALFSHCAEYFPHVFPVKLSFRNTSKNWDTERLSNLHTISQ